MKLTSDEMNVLDEALDAWLDVGSTGLLVGGLLSGMIEDDRSKVEAKYNEEQARFEEKKRLKKIVAAKLKAKLYECLENSELQSQVPGLKSELNRY